MDRVAGIPAGAWALLDVVPDAIIAVDAAGRIVFANAQTERVFGYDRAALVGTPLERLLPERARDRHAEHLRGFFAAPRVRQMGEGLQLFGQHRDGHEVPIEIALSSVVVDGSPVAIAAIRDVTARKQAEAEAATALRTKEEMFKNLLEAAPDALVVIDAERTIRLINRRTSEMFGYSSAELVGAPLEVLMPERFRKRHPRHVAAFAAAPRARPMGDCMELVARRKDGSELHVDVSLSPMSGTEGMLVTAAIRDVTERDRTEKARAAAQRDADEARSQLVALVDHLPDHVVTIDRAGTILFMNRPLPPRTREETIGTSWLTRVSPEHHEIVQAALARVLSTGQPTGYEVPVVGANGEVLRFACTIGPAWRGTEISGAVIIARDVTAARDLEAQLVASERMASMGMLAAGVAHEINNPLSAVVANLELAIYALDERRHQFPDAPTDTLHDELHDELADAQDAARRVRDIVRDLRIFSRTDDEERAPIDLARVVQSTVRMAWNEIRHRAQLVEDYQAVPLVEATESRLGQVFLNLVMNAAQAIPEGRSEANTIRIATRRGPGGEAVVEISDTGCGMAPEVRKQLFVPFFTTKAKGLGTGLGLAICARIVTELGGRIEVESEVGAGSTFRVTLPPARLQEEAPAPARPVAIASDRRGRVLVVDDEPMIGTAIRRALSSEHDVVTSTCAEEALARLRDGERFDVILCDLMMPNLTGQDFFESLGQIADDHTARVIFLTGGAFTPKTREFLAGLTNLRIEKPFDVVWLRALVKDRVHR